MVCGAEVLGKVERLVRESWIHIFNSNFITLTGFWGFGVGVAVGDVG